MRLLLLALIGGLLTACAGSAAAPGDVSYGERFELKAGGNATVGDKGLRVTFERVSLDSRCPVDVDCIHAGQAVVVLRFEVDGASARREVSTARERNAVSYGDYRAELLGLQPAPRSDRTIAPGEYVAELRISVP